MKNVVQEVFVEFYICNLTNFMVIRNSVRIFHEDLPQIKEHEVGGGMWHV